MNTNTQPFHLISSVIWLPLAMVGCLSLAVSATAQETQDDRAQRAQELENKVAALRDEFQQLKLKWDDAAGQAKSNLTADMQEASTELSAAWDELQSTAANQADEVKRQMDRSWGEFEQGRDAARAETAEVLDKFRAQWNAANAQLREYHQQQVQQLREELAALDNQLAAASDEAIEQWVAIRSTIREQYQADVKQMRTAYAEYMESLNNEISQLRRNAEEAGDEAKAEFNEQADALSVELATAHEEVLAGYMELVARAENYVNETQEKLGESGDQAKAQLQSELDAVSAAMCEIRGDMAASWQAWRDQLDSEIAAVEQRAQEVDAENRQRFDEIAGKMRERRAKAHDEMLAAWESAVAGIQAELDRLKAGVDAADDQARGEMIAAIEARQAELETAKQKLQEARDN